MLLWWIIVFVFPGSIHPDFCLGIYLSFIFYPCGSANQPTWQYPSSRKGHLTTQSRQAHQLFQCLDHSGVFRGGHIFQSVLWDPILGKRAALFPLGMLTWSDACLQLLVPIYHHEGIREWSQHSWEKRGETEQDWILMISSEYLEPHLNP